MEQKPTVFIDRDGTINVDGGYINSIDNFIIYPYVAQAIKMLNCNGFLAVIITNQSGIGRGFYTEEVMHTYHDKLNNYLAEYGAKVDGIYYCPHDPNAKIEKYRIECECRKPKTGMIDQAKRDLPVDDSRMYFIGDKYSDMQTGFNINAKTIMVKTGYGAGELDQFATGWKKQPDLIAVNLLDAVKMIIEKN